MSHIDQFPEADFATLGSVSSLSAPKVRREYNRGKGVHSSFYYLTYLRRNCLNLLSALTDLWFTGSIVGLNDQHAHL